MWGACLQYPSEPRHGAHYRLACAYYNGSQIRSHSAVGGSQSNANMFRAYRARVTGNDAVHPGQININDDPIVAAKLFQLVNVIVENLISLPAEIDTIYDSLPETKREAVKKRDSI